MNMNKVSAATATAVGLAMRRPISVCVLVLAMALGASFAVKKMQRDILPNLGIPVIYIAQPYGGLDPSQMEKIGRASCRERV